MSLHELDAVLSSTKRLAALGMLAGAREVDFALMRDHLQLSDSDMSKQMAMLVEAGFVEANKTGRGANRRTWFQITRTGRATLTEHMAALNALILDDLPPPAAPS